MALLQTLRAIDTSRFDVHLAAGRAHDVSLDLLEAGEPIPVLLKPVAQLRRDVHPVKDLIAILHLFAIIVTGRYDIVHTHTSKAGLLGRIAAAAAGVPAVIHSPHGTILQGYFSRRVTWFYATIERLAAHLTQCVICLTRSEIRQCLKAGIGKRDQYTFVHNGIDIAQFAPNPGAHHHLRLEIGIEPNATVFMTVGRLVPVKGHVHLLEAIHTLRKKDPNVRLVVAGEGELRKTLENEAVRLGIGDAVCFLGWREDVDRLLDVADVFVLPSLNEGLGLVIVEAMAKKLPVVATTVGGVPEVVKNGETGFLVPAGEPQPLAEAMQRLSESADLRQAFGCAGFDRAVRLFSIAATVRRTEDVYASIRRATTWS